MWWKTLKNISHLQSWVHLCKDSNQTSMNPWQMWTLANTSIFDITFTYHIWFSTAGMYLVCHHYLCKMILFKIRVSILHSVDQWFLEKDQKKLTKDGNEHTARHRRKTFIIELHKIKKVAVIALKATETNHVFWVKDPLPVKNI